jgi:hypothetical protein
MAFFPNFLRKRYQLQKVAETRTPFPEENIPSILNLLEILRHDNNLWELHFFMDSCELLTLDEIANDALYQMCINPKLREALQWICNKVLLTIGVDNYLSTAVYTRIGTSMLNKLVDDGIISKELNIFYHDNFVANTASLVSAISVEELPF